MTNYADFNTPTTLIMSVLWDLDKAGVTESSASEIATECRKRGGCPHSAMDTDSVRRVLARMELMDMVTSRLVESDHKGFVKGRRVWRIRHYDA